ncbi:MAG: PhoH family protein [Ruminococcaceae bacterium]|nr:PhoH family protein [Oscillospiraceae bacterium]
MGASPFAHRKTGVKILSQRLIELSEKIDIAGLFGSFDANVKLLEKSLQVNIASRDGGIRITGEEDAVEKAGEVLNVLLQLLERGERIDEQKIIYAITMVQENGGFDLKLLGDDCIAVNSRGTPIKTKTLGQKQYVEAMKDNTIVFGIGPAGTGKTYLAVARAVTALRNKEVNRIILTRPAIEAGEKLGFLPGDMQSKVDPYLRPLYDGMYEMLGAEVYQRHVERGVIEVAPLAYMRGRTLDNAFIILDEAQNTTPEQMKMFLTRIGFGSQAVITGDITQIDLPDGKRSGLKETHRILKGIEGIEFCMLTDKDVVRHPLVQKIIKAYEKHEQEQEKKRKNDRATHREQSRKSRDNA